MPDGVRPLSELRSSGLLWLINRAVFHPRGFALAFRLDDSGDVIGWRLDGDGTEPWVFLGAEHSEDELFRAAEATLDAARAVTAEPDLVAGPGERDVMTYSPETGLWTGWAQGQGWDGQ